MHMHQATDPNVGREPVVGHFVHRSILLTCLQKIFRKNNNTVAINVICSDGQSGMMCHTETFGWLKTIPSFSFLINTTPMCQGDIMDHRAWKCSNVVTNRDGDHGQGQHLVFFAAFHYLII